MQNKLFLLLMLLVSCQFWKTSEKEIILFEAKLFLKLASTYRAKIINQEYVNFQIPITRPFFTAQPIIEFETIGDNGNKKAVFCLIYRIPSSKGEGAWLKLTEHPCTYKEDQSRIKLSGIKNLFLGISSNQMDSIRKGEKIKPFHLALAFEKNKKKYLFEIPLLNLSKEEIYLKESKKLRISSVSNARFSNGIVPSIVPGVIFFPLSGENPNQKRVKMIGDISDNYFDGSSKICHQINENCESVEEFSCEQCRFGWFEVVPTKCPLTGDKYCGVDRCGEKGFPACFRGFKFDKTQIFTAGCNPENKSGFCQKGLSVMCDPKGVLVCD